MLTTRQCFNPRARDGRDVEYIGNKNIIIVSIHAPVMDAIFVIMSNNPVVSFNPRARDGRDHNQRLFWFNGRGFNPRARDGRDTYQNPKSAF